MGPLAGGPGVASAGSDAWTDASEHTERRRTRRPRLSLSPASTRSGGKALLFWGTAGCVVLIDLLTKLLAEQWLARFVPHRIIGDVVRFTLAYNPGAAFSMSLGAYSRLIFGAFALVALVVLWRLYRLTGIGARAGDATRIVALGLAWGGAAGNLIDRFRSALGVVDFIDIGYRDIRFWTFNVADSAVTIGALVLAWSLSREDRDQRLAHAVLDRSAGIPEAAVVPLSEAKGPDV